MGCGLDFSSWERFRIFTEGNAKELAEQVTDLTKYNREFDWAKQKLETYSIDATVNALYKELHAIAI